MSRGGNYINFIVEERDKLKDLVAQVSLDMADYIDSRANSEFVLFYKNITHSDLPTFGKATRVNAHEKNLLYYITDHDMQSIEDKTNKPFQTAHQSNIGLMKEIYSIVGLKQPRDNVVYRINDYMNVKLVNETAKYYQALIKLDNPTSLLALIRKQP